MTKQISNRFVSGLIAGCVLYGIMAVLYLVSFFLGIVIPTFLDTAVFVVGFIAGFAIGRRELGKWLSGFLWVGVVAIAYNTLLMVLLLVASTAADDTAILTAMGYAARAYFFVMIGAFIVGYQRNKQKPLPDMTSDDKEARRKEVAARKAEAKQQEQQSTTTDSID
jgi:hypothetical protein